MVGGGCGTARRSATGAPRAIAIGLGGMAPGEAGVLGGLGRILRSTLGSRDLGTRPFERAPKCPFGVSFRRAQRRKEPALKPARRAPDAPDAPAGCQASRHRDGAPSMPIFNPDRSPHPQARGRHSLMLSRGGRGRRSGWVSTLPEPVTTPTPSASTRASGSSERGDRFGCTLRDPVDTGLTPAPSLAAPSSAAGSSIAHLSIAPK